MSTITTWPLKSGNREFCVDHALHVFPICESLLAIVSSASYYYHPLGENFTASEKAGEGEVQCVAIVIARREGLLYSWLCSSLSKNLVTRTIAPPRRKYTFARPEVIMSAQAMMVTCPPGKSYFAGILYVKYIFFFTPMVLHYHLFSQLSHATVNSHRTVFMQQMHTPGERSNSGT